ncbi:MAG: aroF2 [Acidobacteria bacterium]|nr:aroF2 [Acidobacteriota bacterium]
MLVMMRSHATSEEIDAVCRKIEAMGFKPHPIPGSTRTAIGITGNQGPIEAAALESLPGVGECVPVSKPYKLVGRELKEDTTCIDLGDGVRIGGPELAIIAGPCAVETREQTRTIAARVAAAGARLFRGGAAEEGLRILAEVREDYGLKIVTEAIDVESVDLVERYTDVMQIGARNMQNFSLLKRAGRSRCPVLLKRGISATLDELLMAAEYILSEGNYKVILCERGIRTFADHTRNTLDLSVIPAVQRLSHLPIIVDPSHGTGRREKVIPLSRAAIAVGADGLMIEVHHQPEEALSDGNQSIHPLEFEQLMREIGQIAPILGRTLAAGPNVK